jgi:NAD(P)-dependent dehydrogenase (short-subunit alcohol dehydrogenase family)
MTESLGQEFPCVYAGENVNNALVIGAGRGIGLEFVRQFLDRGINCLYATYHQPNCPLLDIDDARLQTWSVDVTKESEIAVVAQEIIAQGVRLDYVIYCVGVLHTADWQPEKSLRHINSQQMLDYFQVNSIGAVLWAKHLQPLFKHGDRSVFASISAKVGSIGDNQLGGWYGYRASKAALNMLVRNISIEYRRTAPGSIVVALHPGTTNTDLSMPFQGNVPPEKLFSAELTVQQLLGVIDRLETKDSGGFFNWDGLPLPW